MQIVNHNNLPGIHSEDSDLLTVICSIFLSMNTLLYGLVAKALGSQSRVPYSKPLGSSKVDSAFHPSAVDKMSTRDFWEPSDKK